MAHINQYLTYIEEENKWYKKSMNVGPDEWDEPTDDKIRVIYLSSDPKTSMPVSRVNYFWLKLFIAMNFVLLIVLITAVIWARRISSKSR